MHMQFNDMLGVFVQCDTVIGVSGLSFDLFLCRITPKASGGEILEGS